MQQNTYSTSQLDSLTKGNYRVAENERHAFHARIEVKQFDQRTGERQSIPILQKFEFKGFAEVLDGLKRQGYTVDILYDPTDYLAEQRRAQIAYQKQTQEAQAAAIKAKRDAEKEALKAEMRAELKKEAEAELAEEAEMEAAAKKAKEAEAKKVKK